MRSFMRYLSVKHSACSNPMPGMPKARFSTDNSLTRLSLRFMTIRILSLYGSLLTVSASAWSSRGSESIR